MADPPIGFTQTTTGDSICNSCKHWKGYAGCFLKAGNNNRHLKQTSCSHYSNQPNNK